jgi:hypothetical protein
VLRRVALVLAVEGLLLLAVAGWYGGVTLRSDGDKGAPGAEAVSAAVAALLLLLLARAVGRGKRWARSPAVTVNLIALPVALYSFQGGAWYVGAPVVLLAASVLYLFGTPELRDRFRES